MRKLVGKNSLFQAFRSECGFWLEFESQSTTPLEIIAFDQMAEARFELGTCKLDPYGNGRIAIDDDTGIAEVVIGSESFTLVLREDAVAA